MRAIPHSTPPAIDSHPRETTGGITRRKVLARIAAAAPLGLADLAFTGCHKSNSARPISAGLDLARLHTTAETLREFDRRSRYCFQIPSAPYESPVDLRRHVVYPIYRRDLRLLAESISGVLNDSALAPLHPQAQEVRTLLAGLERQWSAPEASPDSGTGDLAIITSHRTLRAVLGRTALTSVPLCQGLSLLEKGVGARESRQIVEGLFPESRPLPQQQTALALCYESLALSEYTNGTNGAPNLGSIGRDIELARSFLNRVMKNGIPRDTNRSFRVEEQQRLATIEEVANGALRNFAPFLFGSGPEPGWGEAFRRVTEAVGRRG